MTDRYLVTLHGHGGSAELAADWAARLDPTASWHHITPQGPVVETTGGHAWFVDHAGSPHGVTAAGRVIASLLSGLVEDAGVDPGRIAVAGWSQGAAAALAALTTTRTHRVGALLVASGFLAEGDAEYDLASLAGLPVLLQHGVHDEVVPAFFAADLAASLTAAGAVVSQQRFELGHERSPEADAAAQDWLESVIP